MAEDHANGTSGGGQAAKPWAHYSRTKRERRKAAGLCITCGGPREGPAVLTCVPCLEKLRERGRVIRERRRAARPPKPDVPKATADMAAYKRAWRAARKATGACTTCGGARDVDGCVRCAACQAKDNANYQRIGKARYQARADEVNGAAQERRRLWKEAGLCSWCGGERDDLKRKRCAECRQKQKATNAAVADECKRLGLCWRCKVPIGCSGYCDPCREIMRQDYRRHMEANPDQFRVRSHRRRTRIKANGGTLTVAEWHAIKASQGHRCLCCGRQEPEIWLTIDHVIPITKGGPHTAENVVGLCSYCNKSKGARHIDYRRPDPAIED